MTAPLSLRWAVAKAALLGRVIGIAVKVTDTGTEYRVAMTSEVVRPWLARNQKRRELIRQGKESAAQRIRGIWTDGLTDDADPVFEDPDATLQRISDELDRIERL